MRLKDFFRSEWAGVTVAWERWGAAVRAQSAAATGWIAELAEVREGMAVLDLASGTGDPAVTLARLVGSGGRVVATDLVPGALGMVERAARSAGLAQLSTRPADMEGLPFDDASFDAVTCRLGLMFCPRPEVALGEARRVLRPGGRAAFVAWGDPAQPLFAATLGALDRSLATGAAAEAGGASSAADGGGVADGASDPRSPTSEAPGPFRYADPARLGAALTAAGFTDVRAEERVVPWPFTGSGADMWRMFLDLGGPSLKGQVDALDDPTRRALADLVAATLEGHRRGGVVDPTARLVGAVGVRGRGG